MENWKAEQVKQNQISALTHDLKTPLTVARGNAELLAMTPLNAEQTDLLEHFEKGVARVDAHRERVGRTQQSEFEENLDA